MSLSIIVLLISMVLGIRYGLVMIGMHKGPLLATFEEYGENDPVYYPLPHLLLWPGLIAITTSDVLHMILPVTVTFEPIGITMLVGAAFSLYWRNRIKPYWSNLLTFPAWHAQLLETATRLERRRIAYMWLRLPWRTRLLYNANDRLFFVWAEQVIVATLH